MKRTARNEAEVVQTNKAQRIMMITIIVMFVVSLIPIFYVGLHTYPSGDDYWYGKYIAKAWREQHSIFACLCAALATIKEFYYTWQGTWYSIFLFCFNPEMLMSGGYKLVPLIAIGLLGGGFALLMYQTMVRELKIDKEIVVVCFLILLFQMLQYMPRTTSGIFWFNGIMHYNANTFTSMVAIAMMIVFVRSGKKYAYVLAVLAMLLIGGGNYQAALMPLMFWALLVMGTFFNVAQKTGIKERFIKMLHAKRVWLLSLGIVFELIGLAISGTAPGNSVRSEEFEISIKWALQSVYYSIDRGIYLVRDDFYVPYPSMLIFIVLLAVLLWFSMWKIQDKITFRFPVPALFVLYMCGIYWAMYTPGIFSKSDVSGGVPDTIQQIFLVTSLANVVYVIGYVQRVIHEHVNVEKTNNAWWGRKFENTKVENYILIVATIGILIAGVAGYSKSTNQICMNYVNSGHMKVYDTVRREQLRILKDEDVRDAVIPELYDYDYYPVCHFQVFADPEYKFNREEAIYYGKDSVTGYDFRKWFEQEGYSY